MTTLNHETSSIYSQLQSWDMTAVKSYLVSKNIYTATEAEEMEAEYKKYIALAVSNKAKALPMSNLVDPFWHTHMIFSHDYVAMSNKFNGEYIHHVPAEISEESGDFEEFASLYNSTFGTPNPAIWNKSCCSNCIN